MLGKEEDVNLLPDLIKKMIKAANKHFYDNEKGVFISEESNQISTASQCWMILSETISAKKGKKILGQLDKVDNVILPVSPYMYHYVLESMITCGMHTEARDLLNSYWGGMIKKGADTFWEVYDPQDDFLSPYQSHIMNSYCHAWSCTPIYFIRKYYTELFAED